MTCCGTADLGNAGKNLLHGSAPRYGLLTFANNTGLLDVYLQRIIIYINFPLIYVI